jgi:hypothetical protein
VLEKLEKAYGVRRKNGKRANAWALWEAILHCARWKEPLPEWVCEALEIANLKNLKGDLVSFNSLFGPQDESTSCKTEARLYKGIGSCRHSDSGGQKWRGPIRRMVRRSRQARG